MSWSHAEIVGALRPYERSLEAGGLRRISIDSISPTRTASSDGGLATTPPVVHGPCVGQRRTRGDSRPRISNWRSVPTNRPFGWPDSDPVR